MNRPLDDHDRRLRLPLGAMIVTIVVASLGIPTLVDRVGAGTDSLAPLAPPTDLESSPGTAAGESPSSSDPTVTISPSAPTPADSRADAATPTTTEPAISSPSTSLPVMAGRPVPSTDIAIGNDAPGSVRSIQLVPPMRDVIVQVAGRDIASDADGIVQVPPADSDAGFVFIGIRADPSLVEVSLDTWSDGSTATRRSLADVDGPVADVAMIVSNRVTVGPTSSAPGGSTVVFDSDLGSVTLTVGTSTWVPASRGVLDGDEFTEQDVTYVARTLTVGGEESDLAGARFTPTPEAVWIMVDPDA